MFSTICNSKKYFSGLRRLSGNPRLWARVVDVVRTRPREDLVPSKQMTLEKISRLNKRKGPRGSGKRMQRARGVGQKETLRRGGGLEGVCVERGWEARLRIVLIH